MSVYVDKEINPFGRMIMCHMIADSLPELHAMAERIGMKRDWFQCKRMPHYDLARWRRARAVAEGAIEIDRKRAGRIVREWRLRGWKDRPAVEVPTP